MGTGKRQLRFSGKAITARKIGKRAKSPNRLKTVVLSFCFQVKNSDGASLKFHVRCATEFKTCYVLWRSPATGVLAVCHPDTIKVIQSSNAPKADSYRFSKPFFGKSEKRNSCYTCLEVVIFQCFWRDSLCRQNNNNHFVRYVTLQELYRDVSEICSAPHELAWFDHEGFAGEGRKMRTNLLRGYYHLSKNCDQRFRTIF